jgi:Na+/H+ antiporter NhaD/arsenite permease-like protein
MQRFKLKQLGMWFSITFAIWLGADAVLVDSFQAIAIAALGGAIGGTILFGEERLPFVLFSIVLLLVTKTLDFTHFIEGVEWKLLVKFIGLLVWVEYLYLSGFFEALMHWILPKGLRGAILLVVLCLLAFISSALIDEVNSIVIIILMTQAIIGFTAKKLRMSEKNLGHVTVLLVSVTNIGSQLLPLGNPVGIAISTIAGFTAVDFIRRGWVPAIITLVTYLFLVRRFYPSLFTDFASVELEEEDYETREEMGHTSVGYEVEEVSNGHTHVSHETPAFGLLMLLFIFGIVGLVVSQPLATSLGYEGSTGVGLFSILLGGITLYIASCYGTHNEGLLKQIPWSTLLFIVLLFGIAHSLEQTGLTLLIAETIKNAVGDNTLLLIGIIGFVGGLMTAVMDNVIAIAVLGGIISQLGAIGVDVGVLWMSLLAAGVVAANATPIGSAANIIANNKTKLSWIQWWQYGGWLAPITTVINLAGIYLWDLLL